MRISFSSSCERNCCVDEFLVLSHRALDELDVLTDAGLGVCTLALLGNGHAVLSL